MEEPKMIENASSRQITFNKRRWGLFKKAHELSVLCDSDVAIILYSSTGKLYEFCSSSMKGILKRFNKSMEYFKNRATGNKPEESEEAVVLEENVTDPKKEQLRLLGKDLTEMSSQELQVLVQQLNEGLLCLKERKEQILMQQLEQSRMQGQQALLENETLRRQVQELQGALPSTVEPAPSAPLYIQYPAQKTACNRGVDGERDTVLPSGLPKWFYRKRKAHDLEA